MKTDYKFKADDIIEYKGSIYIVIDVVIDDYFLLKITGSSRCKECFNIGSVDTIATKVTDPCAILITELIMVLRRGFEK